jgi:hypothetical protein
MGIRIPHGMGAYSGRAVTVERVSLARVAAVLVVAPTTLPSRWLPIGVERPVGSKKPNVCSAHRVDLFAARRLNCRAVEVDGCGGVAV